MSFARFILARPEGVRQSENFLKSFALRDTVPCSVRHGCCCTRRLYVPFVLAAALLDARFRILATCGRAGLDRDHDDGLHVERVASLCRCLVSQMDDLAHALTGCGNSTTMDRDRHLHGRRFRETRAVHFGAEALVLKAEILWTNLSRFHRFVLKAQAEPDRDRSG
jgi:hypothetical protein